PVAQGIGLGLDTFVVPLQCVRVVGCSVCGGAKRPGKFPSMLPLCQAPIRLFLPPMLWALGHSADRSGGFLWPGDPSSALGRCKQGVYHPYLRLRGVAWGV